MSRRFGPRGASPLIPVAWWPTTCRSTSRPEAPCCTSSVAAACRATQDGQHRIICLCSTLERLHDLGLDVVLSDRNAAMRVADFHRWADGEPEDGFIDWPLMKETIWSSDDEHPDRMERRMAECLVHGSVPWEALMFVGARDQTVADEVVSLVGTDESAPSVAVRRHWYF